MKRRELLRRIPSLPLAIAGIATGAPPAARAPMHVIRLDRPVSEAVMEQIRRTWDAAYRAGKTIVLSHGIRIERIDR